LLRNSVLFCFIYANKKKDIYYTKTVSFFSIFFWLRIIW